VNVVETGIVGDKREVGLVTYSPTRAFN